MTTAEEVEIEASKLVKLLSTDFIRALPPNNFSCWPVSAGGGGGGGRRLSSLDELKISTIIPVRLIPLDITDLLFERFNSEVSVVAVFGSMSVGSEGSNTASTSEIGVPGIACLNPGLVDSSVLVIIGAVVWSMRTCSMIALEVDGLAFTSYEETIRDEMDAVLVVRFV